jgi:hypothetical protein
MLFYQKISMVGITIKSDLRLKSNYQQSGEISGKKKKGGGQYRSIYKRQFHTLQDCISRFFWLLLIISDIWWMVTTDSRSMMITDTIHVQK